MIVSERIGQKLHKQDLLRGAYHFFRPVKDPNIQARLFIGQVKLKIGDLPPVVDVENANRQSTNISARICRSFWICLKMNIMLSLLSIQTYLSTTRHLAGKFTNILSGLHIISKILLSYPMKETGVSGNILKAVMLMGSKEK